LLKISVFEMCFKYLTVRGQTDSRWKLVVTGLTQKFINVGTAFENECYCSVALSIACVNGYVEVANALLMKNFCYPF
jgi:hypothetical protein